MKSLRLNKQITGNLYCSEDFKILSQDPKKVVIQGLLLPKDQVSRNGILYDWDSIKNTYQQLIGRPLMYNHIIDTHMAPLGTVIDSWLIEQESDGQLPGWYYKADLDPESEYTRKILRGDLNKVSIQLRAGEAVEESSADNSTRFQRAYVSDVLEMSVVPVPGFIDSSIEIALAEAFKVLRETGGMTTVNNPVATKMPEKEAFDSFPMDAFHIGLASEINAHPEVDPLEVGKIVLNNLISDKDYYKTEGMVDQVSDEECKDILSDI